MLGSEPDGDGLRNIVKLSDEKKLRDLQLKHYRMSTAQFKKRTTHLDILGRFYYLSPACVKNVPILQFDKVEA